MFSNTEIADVQVLNHTDANELAEFAKVNAAWCSAAGETFCAFYTLTCFSWFQLQLAVSELFSFGDAGDPAIAQAQL